MPIIRTLGCPTCNHIMEVTLTLDQVDEPPPPCPQCAAQEMRQEFRPVAIRGTAARNRDTANRITEAIAAEDYHVADMQRDAYPGATPKVRYAPTDLNGNRIADTRPVRSTDASQWNASAQTIEAAIASGRRMREQFGSGLDVLQQSLAKGWQRDLIADSKKRSARIY